METSTKPCRNKFPCGFCDGRYGSVQELFVHLFQYHREEKLIPGTNQDGFFANFFSIKKNRRVHCVCGRSFSYRKTDLDLTSPLFKFGSIALMEPFVCHLKEVRDFRQHVEQARWEARLRQIAESASESSAMTSCVQKKYNWIVGKEINDLIGGIQFEWMQLPDEA